MFGDYITSLQTFTKQFGDSFPEISSLESLNDIRYWNDQFPREKAILLSYEILIKLKNVYGDAIKLQFLLGNLVIFNLTSTVTEKVIDQFRNDTNQAKFVTIDLEINKNILLSTIWPQLFPTSNPYLFLFSAPFERLLSNKSFTYLEQKLWETNQYKKLIIILFERDLFLNGPYFTLLGGKNIELLGTISEVNEIAKEELASIFEKYQNTIKWQFEFIKFLTPFHLSFSVIDGENDILTTSLKMKYINILLLYLSDHTIIRGDNYVSIFSTTQQNIEIMHFDQKVFTGLLQDNNISYFQKIFEWAYLSDWDLVDRLPFVQISFVQVLNSINNSLRQKGIIENISSIYKNVIWQWKAFIEGRVNEFIYQENDLEDFVSSSIQSFSDQTNQLIKNVSDTMLAAIGAFIGSFIASLFTETFNIFIFQIGLWMYSAYVLLFPFYINMKTQYDHFLAFNNDFCFRKKRFLEKLSADRVNNIVGNRFDNAVKRFNFVFYIILFLYAAIIIAGVYCSFYLPPIIISTMPTP